MDIRNFFGKQGAKKKPEKKEEPVEDDDAPLKPAPSKRPRRQVQSRATPPEKPRGRPKRAAAAAASGTRSRKKKATDSDDDDDAFVVDDDEEEEESDAAPSAVEEDSDDDAKVAVVKTKRRGRGRPTKVEVSDDEPMVVSPVKSKAAGDKPRKFEKEPVIERKKFVPSAEALWVDKYKPNALGDLCANPGHATTLMKWLQSWRSIHLNAPKGKAKAQPGQEKAALLAGSPGIGKTSLAHAVCRELKMETMELNASDTRNKGSIGDVVGSLSVNEAIGKYMHIVDRPANLKPGGQVLIMDEVDGMSAGDRGGMQELIKIIKTTKIPIICICNDDSNPKVRSLANYCLKLKFRRPMVKQVQKRLRYICNQENYRDVPQDALESIAESCNGDIRQMINMLQNWHSRGDSLSVGDVKGYLQSEGKTFQTQAIFDLFRTLFERMDKYFMDPDLVPLMVQENYLSYYATEDEEKMANAAEAMSIADLANRTLREEGRWDLMPSIALLSSVLPGSIVASNLTGAPKFPSWLGKMSSERKFVRLAQEIDMHIKTRVNSDWRNLLLDYAPCLRSHLSLPLIRRGKEGIEDVIDLLDEYFLSREDWETILDLTSVQQKSNPKDSIPSAVKSAFTRTYESGSHMNSTVSSVQVKKASAAPKESMPDEDVIVEKDEVSEEEPADDKKGDQADKDGLVKIGKGKGGRGKKAGASSSAAKGSTRGRKRKA